MMTGSLFTVTSSSAVIVWLQNAAWPRCCLQTLNERTHMHRKEKKKKSADTLFQITALTESLKPT